MPDEPNSGPPPVQLTAPPQEAAPWAAPPPAGGYPQTSNPLDALIPTKNPPALISYHCGLFSITMCFSPILSPIAIIYGRKALKNFAANPEVKGKTHAIVGISVGTFSLVVTIAFALFVWWS